MPNHVSLDHRTPEDDATTAIRHHWDRRASTFDDEKGHGVHTPAQRQAWLDELSRVAGPAPLRILDVGCGTGVLSMLFAELGHRVTGIDLAPKMLEVARRKAAESGLDVRFRCENAATVNDPNASYDLVIARHVIWVLPDPAAGAREWLRVLAPGGRLALIEGKWGPDAQAAPPASGLARLVTSAVLAGSRAVRRLLGEKPLVGALSRLHNWHYQRVQATLPFAGGADRERLVALLQSLGVRDVAVEPMEDAVLWGDGPAYPRYLVIGRRA